MNEIKLPFALSEETGRIIAITDESVMSGINNSQFVCPECQTVLVAKKGDIKQHHFAHYAISSTCSGESIYHIVVKHLIQQYLEFNIPPLPIFTCGKIEPQTLQFDRVDVECSLGTKFQFDVVGFVNNNPTCIIEVFNTHKTNDPEKLKAIKQLDLLAIELNIKHLLPTSFRVPADIVKDSIYSTAYKSYLNIPTVAILPDAIVNYEGEIQYLRDTLREYDAQVTKRDEKIAQLTNELLELEHELYKAEHAESHTSMENNELKRRISSQSEIGNISNLKNKAFFDKYEACVNKYEGATIFLPHSELIKLPPDRLGRIKLVIGRNKDRGGPKAFWIRIKDHLQTLEEENEIKNRIDRGDTEWK